MGSFELHKGTYLALDSILHHLFLCAIPGECEASLLTPLGGLVQVEMEDFEEALKEVKPAFGAVTETLEAYRLNGVIDYGEHFRHLLSVCKQLVEQASPVLLQPLDGLGHLYGAGGSVKTLCWSEASVRPPCGPFSHWMPSCRYCCVQAAAHKSRSDVIQC